MDEDVGAEASEITNSSSGVAAMRQGVFTAIRNRALPV
jgi:hypothetical protein